MDPLSVLKTLWRHKLILIPVMVVTLVAAGYLYAFGPRSYQATATYALVNPLVPTEQEVLKDPSLGKLNSNNPYLRSSDNTLIAQVLTTRLGTPEVAKSLEIQGLSPEFTVERAGSFGSGLLVQVTVIGASPEAAVETVHVLGEYLVKELEAMQAINGADTRFFFTALAITPGEEATEQFSSRLRAVIMVGAGGVVLLFAAVSAAQALDKRRKPRKSRRSQSLIEKKKNRRKSNLESNDKIFENTGRSSTRNLPGKSPMRAANSPTTKDLIRDRKDYYQRKARNKTKL